MEKEWYRGLQRAAIQNKLECTSKNLLHTDAAWEAVPSVFFWHTKKPFNGFLSSYKSFSAYIGSTLFLFCALRLKAIPQNGIFQKSNKLFLWSLIWKSEEIQENFIGRDTSAEVEVSVLLPLFFLFFQNTSQTYSHLASSNLSWRGLFFSKVYYKINVLSSTISREHWPAAQVTNQHETFIKTYCKGYTVLGARFYHFFQNSITTEWNFCHKSVSWC